MSKHSARGGEDISVASFLLYLIAFVAGLAGFALGVGRMLVVVGAALMVDAMRSSPGRIGQILQGLPLGLSPQTVSTASMALSYIGLPVLAAVLLRRVYGALRLPGFVDRVLGAALGGVAGAAVGHWMVG